jgi:hypothetical protein
MIAVILLAVAALSLSACGSRPGEVTGTVTRTGDGSPVTGAEVTVFSLTQFKDVSNVDAFRKGHAVQTATTGDDGAFSFSLEPDKYQFEVKAEGMQPTSRLLEVKPGRGIEVEFSLAPASP